MPYRVETALVFSTITFLAGIILLLLAPKIPRTLPRFLFYIGSALFIIMAFAGMQPVLSYVFEFILSFLGY